MERTRGNQDRRKHQNKDDLSHKDDLLLQRIQELAQQGLLPVWRVAEEFGRLKEFLWTGWLYVCRLYLWFKIYKDIDVKKQEFSKVWVRVESTK